MTDRIANLWGNRTPFGGGEEWPVRVDQVLERPSRCGGSGRGLGVPHAQHPGVQVNVTPPEIEQLALPHARMDGEQLAGIKLEEVASVRRPKCKAPNCPEYYRARPFSRDNL